MSEHRILIGEKQETVRAIAKRLGVSTTTVYAKERKRKRLEGWGDRYPSAKFFPSLEPWARRNLWSDGIRTVEDLVKAGPDRIAKIYGLRKPSSKSRVELTKVLAEMGIEFFPGDGRLHHCKTCRCKK